MNSNFILHLIEYLFKILMDFNLLSFTMCEIKKIYIYFIFIFNRLESLVLFVVHFIIVNVVRCGDPNEVKKKVNL